MPEKKSSFVLMSRQLLVFGTVAALTAPAAGVVSLDIVGPGHTGEQETAAPRTVALVASRPVSPSVREVPLRGVASAGLRVMGRRQSSGGEVGRLAALSAPQPVEGMATVGVTWDRSERLEEDEITVSVRTREGGAWSAWRTVEYHEEHAPTVGTLEARRARAGTDPIVIGEVDEVQVKLRTEDGQVPADASMALVDPRDTPTPQVAEPAIDTAAIPGEGAVSLSSATAPPADDESPAPEAPEEADEGTGLLTAAVGITPKPRIFSRAQWGADERLRDRPSLRYHEVHAGFVHHTVNGNDYTRAEVPSILRGIYAYHTKSRGWSDIGYNFVVDRFGRIWEGRYGGVDRPVVGAHTLNYNEYSFAMAALGDFDKVRPSSAMLDAYGRLFAWKLSLHGVSASSTQQWVGRRYFPAINGHRDAGSTACPGRHLYARIDRIRSLATLYQAPFTARTRSTNLAGTPWPDLVVRDEETRKVYVARTGGQTNFQRRQVAATGWRGKDLVVPAGDVNGDGVPDMLARDRSTKVLTVHPGTPQGTFGDPVRETPRFDETEMLVGVLDMTGNGKDDLVGREAGEDDLWLYPGRARTGFGRRVRLSGSWGAYDITAGAGDLDGDGRRDLVARSGATLYLFPGRGRSIGAPVELPGRWGRFSMISGVGDLTNDRRPDLLVKVRKNGRVFIYPGDGDGGFGHRLGPFDRFKRLDRLAVAGQLVGDPSNDLVGRTSTGRILVFPHNGGRNLEGLVDTGLVLPRANLLLNVGDWNGDGFGDLMVRTGRGVLQLRLGDGKGRFGSAIRVARRWNRVRLVAAVGDITGDGYPDLMGQPKDEAMRIYPGDGQTGLLPSYVAHSPISSDRHTGLGLWDSDGSPDSLLRRQDGTLVLYRGNGPGGLLNPSDLGRGTRKYDWLQAVGDATGDGRPDLLARHRTTGALWLLPGRKAGFGLRRLVADGFDAYDLSS